MRFYTHHIGDFNSATRHLTRVERSIYRDLLELYYDTEEALTSDIDLLARKVIARSEEERAGLVLVLEEFFTLENGRFINDRCETVLTDYFEAQDALEEKKKAERERKQRYRDARRELFKEAARLGIDTKITLTNEQLKDLISMSRGTPTGKDEEGTAKPLTINHKPLTNNQYINFDDFYSIFPKKVKKQEAQAAWKKLKVTEELFNEIKAHFLVAYQHTEKKYIPNPATYLNKRRWEDEIIDEPPPSSPSTGQQQSEPDYLETRTSRAWAAGMKDPKVIN